MADIKETNNNNNVDGGNVTPEADTKENSTKETKPEVKTFTQEEVDRIVRDRLAKEKKRAEQEKAENKIR